MTAFLSVRGAKFLKGTAKAPRRLPDAIAGRNARTGSFLRDLMGCAALGVVGGVVFFVAWQVGGLIP